MAAFSAKNARVQLNGTNLFAMKWTITTKVDELDVTNFEGNGYASWIGGIQDADVSCDCIFDSTADNLTGAPTIVSGAIISNCRFYLDKTGTFTAGFWSFPSLLIATVAMDTEVRGFVKFSFTAKNANSGTFVYP